MSSVETGQMSAVETGQMSAAETGQMSAVETRQMSSVARTDICFVSTHNVDVSEVSTGQVSDKPFGPKSTKMFRNGFRMVARFVRIGPQASPGHFLTSGPGPAAQNRQNIAQTPDQPHPAELLTQAWAGFGNSKAGLAICTWRQLMHKLT